MIMTCSSDLMTCCREVGGGLRLIYADVVDTARALEQRHSAGPTAGLVLAEALAGVALMSAQLSGKGDTLSLNVEVSGPAEELWIEADGDGALRGGVRVNAMDALDGREETDTGDALGEHADVRIVRSGRGGVGRPMHFSLEPAAMDQIAERYLRHVLHSPVRVVLTALAYDQYLDLSRGLAFFCPPGADREHFDRLGAMADDNSLMDALESEASLSDLAEVLELGGLREVRERSLCLRCPCSLGDAETMLRNLSSRQLERLRAGARAHHRVRCRLCGAEYAVGADMLDAMQPGRGDGV